MAGATKKKKLEKVSQEEIVPAVSQQKFYCCRCGLAYSRLKGFFPVSHSPMFRGTGYLPWCNECVDDLFEQYRREYGDDRAAMRQICMKFDLYWSDSIYDMVERSAGIHSKVRSYIGKSNIIRYINKSFDDTLKEEAAAANSNSDAKPVVNSVVEEEIEEEEPVVVPEETISFWGPGYSPKMYMELEERRKYFVSRYPEGYVFDIGEETLIRQICNLEIDINHDRAAGKSVEKSVNMVNTLVGSLNLKPAQRKTDEADAALETMPFGVGIMKFENTRPIPEPDPDFEDVDGIVRYITVWFLGHLCKMLGIKNSYCKLYEEEMERLRVSAPEFEDEDDEALFNDIFSNGQEEEA